MNSVVLFRVATKSILKNRMRSLLTMLGIIIGVSAVIVMVAIGQGAQSEIRSRIENLGTNLIVITAGSSSAGGTSQGAGTFTRLTVDDVEKLEREAFYVSAVSPVIFTRTQVVGGQGNWRTTINGVSTDYQTIRDWSLESGRFFDRSDVQAMRKVAVLGWTVANDLFPGLDPVGSMVRLRNVPFEVIGVLAEKGQTASGNDQDDVILAPYTTVQTRLAGRFFIPQILVSASSSADVPAAQEEARAIMREAHGLTESDPDDFEIRNQSELAETAQETTQVMTLLLAAIAGISLLVGGIGIMNIMLVSVTERTREIGIRMALGARGSDVLTQFLVESTVMTLLGGAIGVALGYLGAMLLGRFMGWATVVSPGTAVVGLVFSAVVGIFFGFYPASKAAKLNPIEALRYE
jgi:putative ABC transport system permease protein